MKIFGEILAVIFPERCLGCSRKDTTLCESCAIKLPRGFSPDQKTLSVLDYGDKRVKKSLRLFKYRNKRSLAKVFAEIIHNSLLEELSELRLMKNFTNPLLIPIPVSAKRFRERGYNQTELLARELIKLLDDNDVMVKTNILVKSRDTPSQAKTESKRERLSNLRGSFSIKNPDEIRGRNIILLDDIVTTGATLAEARNVLKKSGAKNILCVTVAH